MHLKHKTALGLVFFMFSIMFAQKTIHGQAVWVAYNGQYKLTNKFARI